MPNVIRKEVVARALNRLREQRTHTNFAGYLYLRQRSSQLGRLTDLQPVFLPFFRQFFMVDHHPLGAPYIKIFTEQTPSDANLWLNENVAGSYAPSSLRPDKPFRSVVEVDPDKKTYSLPPNHADLALKHLLFDQSVSAVDLAIFLYRDYGMSLDARVQDLLRIFTFEFGYSDEAYGGSSEEFEKLYNMNSLADGEDDYFEYYE